jgi:hypothetical protein
MRDAHTIVLGITMRITAGSSIKAAARVSFGGNSCCFACRPWLHARNAGLCGRLPEQPRTGPRQAHRPERS